MFHVCRKIWPLVNVINFKFVPANLRVLFGNFVGFLWGIYVMQLTNSSAAKSA